MTKLKLTHSLLLVVRNFGPFDALEVSIEGIFTMVDPSVGLPMSLGGALAGDTPPEPAIGTRMIPMCIGLIPRVAAWVAADVFRIASIM